MEENQIKKEISLRIKSYRKNNKLTQDQLGSAIGFEQKNFSRLESGNSLPSILTICKLIEQGIEPNYLFGFLFPFKKNYTSCDFELVDSVVNLSEKSKMLLKEFINSLK